MKDIPDPLYEGYTEIKENEIPILDSEPVQRLRRVRQLGLSSTVYPGATHSRFIHSIGVLRLASRFAEQMNLDPVIRKTARIAGLLHDVGHGPYSHAIEAAYQDYPDHEEYSIEIVESLSDKGILPVSETAIKKQIRGEAEVPIIAGDIDADRIDYLNRDSKFTGNRLGTVEHHTLIKNARYIDGEIVYHRNAVEALEGMLLARKNMIGSVYQHPTARIAEQMLQEALSHYTEYPPEEILRFDDSQLHSKLLDSDNPISTELYKNIINRNLYKSGYEIRDSDITSSNEEFNSVINQSELKQHILSELDSADPHEVLIDFQRESTSKLDIKIYDGDSINSIQRYSSIEAMLDEPNDIMRFAVYTKPEYREDISELVTKFFEQYNILPEKFHT